MNRSDQYYADNREKVLKRIAKNYQLNKEKKKKYSKQYYQDNKDMICVKRKLKYLETGT